MAMRGAWWLAAAWLGAGCSLIYDPSELPPAADAAPDAPMVEVVDPAQMVLHAVRPAVLVEGTGAGGGRAAVLVVYGDHLARAGLTVTLAAAAGAPRAPLLAVDDAQLDVERNGHRLAVPVVLPVDPDLGAGASIALDVTVSQDTPAGTRAQTLRGALVVEGRDELIGAAEAGSFGGGPREYSKIELTSGTLSGGGDAPLALRSTSSIAIAETVAVTVAAAGAAGGPGGGDGGRGGAILGGVGGSGSGPAPGIASGQPGGFDASDPGLSTLAAPNRGSGGAGGDGSTLGPGGDGGGGGGSIELTAAGDLSVGAIDARGAAGGGGGGGGAGGGGSGGVILVRAGGALVAKGLDVRGGGLGHAGRARYDAGGAASVPAGALGTDHRQGAMFAAAPLVTRSPTPTVTVRGEPFEPYRYFITDEAGDIAGPFEGAIGAATATLELPRLREGLSEVCLVAPGATLASPTRNCISIALMYDPLQ